ncbi:MAG: hypothetical protein R6V45_11190 [Oceanipulchritudo sp.]
MPLALQGQSSSADLEQRIAELEAELEEARSQLVETESEAVEAQQRAELAETELADVADAGPSKIQLGNFSIGGAIRANYVIGDYPTASGPSRGGDGGNFELDTFRVNVDYADDAGYLGKLEYRWYNGYNFLHTGWVGFQIDEDSQVQVGVNRVPFGPGPYGISNSWFFDQHYYVGLSDDMDLGIKYSTVMGPWNFDFAYYVSDEGQWRGASRDSARYSYDIVKNENGNGYEERNQVNARAIYNFDEGSMLTSLGGSIQFGQLDAAGTSGSDGDTFAASVHGKATVGEVNFTGQLTYYDYDVGADNEWNSGDLVVMGAYDFAWPVAGKAWIPAIAASMTFIPEGLDWLDSVTPYVEYSNIMKNESSFNDSEMLVLGAAWWRGGWYIYTDFAYSNGNYFVGLDEFTTFGANPNDEWQSRFNINFGYYF